VNLVRVGRIVRTLRRNRAWRQVDLAKRASSSQQAISLIECGRGNRVSLRTLNRVVGALDAELDLSVRWHGGQLERLMDEHHARLVSAAVDRLEGDGWEVRTEVTYAVGLERGSIDLLGFHQGRAALLCVEVKSELLSVEAALRKHDEKVRIAAGVSDSRLGWRAATVSRMLVLPDHTTAHRRVQAHGRLFAHAYPLRGWALRAWLRNPSNEGSGVLFLPATKHRGSRPEERGHRRVANIRGTPT